MRKSFKRIAILIFILLVGLAAVLYINILVSGKVIDVSNVVEVTVNSNGVNRTYTGQSAVDYLTNINEDIKVKKSTYIYNEVERVEQVPRNDLSKRITEKFENRSNSIIKLDFKFNATQSWLIDTDLETKYREVVIKELGVEWTNTYSMSAKIEKNIPIANSAHIEFYPIMKYSHGYIEHWYEYANNKDIKICVMKKEIETYSPQYIEENGSRVLSGVFNVVYEDLED